MLWSTFSETLINSWTLVKETLARDFDPQIFLLPLLKEYFARVRASMVAAGPNVNNPSCIVYDPKMGFGYKGFQQAANPSTSAIPQIYLHYEPVYIDLLLALSERTLFSTFSNESVVLLKSVWRWLGAFTSPRVHPEQSAMQREHNKLFETAQSTVTNNTGSLLLPTIDQLLSTSTPAVDSSSNTPKHEVHADKALLESIVRTCLEAQRTPSFHGVGICRSPGARSLATVYNVSLHYFT